VLPLLSRSLCIVSFADDLDAAQRPAEVFYDAPSPAAVALVMMKRHATSQACANHRSLLIQRAGPAETAPSWTGAPSKGGRAAPPGVVLS